jgi:hypothetical protein
VPRSGWRAISTAGTAIISTAASSRPGRGGSGCSARYQAIIIGTAIFIISEGWKRTGPRLSQRCAPLPMTPRPSTASSSSMPIRKIHGVHMRSR